MPSIVTHELFSKDVLKNVKHSDNIDLNTYKIFAQSFDMLFYYSFFLPMFGKKERDLANYAHTHEVNNYFKNIITYIESHDLTNNSQVLGYLYGSICHYVLDSYCHPYVFYFTGDANQDKSKRGEHERMEVSLDAYMLKYKENQELCKSNMTNRLFPKVIVSPALRDCIETTFVNTFGVDKMGKKYFRGVRTGRFIMRYFVTDRQGIKKQVYKVKDLLVPSKTRKYQYFSFYIKKIDPFFLNDNHKTWLYPAMPSINRKYSFVELYNESVKDASKIINSIDSYFHGQKKLEDVLTLIGNNSYVTGVDASEVHYMTYFYEE